MKLAPETLHDLADMLDGLAIELGDAVYDLELAGFAETGEHLAVTEARNAVNRAFMMLQRRAGWAKEG